MKLVQTFFLNSNLIDTQMRNFLFEYLQIRVKSWHELLFDGLRYFKLSFLYLVLSRFFLVSQVLFQNGNCRFEPFSLSAYLCSEISELNVLPL